MNARAPAPNVPRPAPIAASAAASSRRRTGWAARRSPATMPSGQRRQIVRQGRGLGRDARQRGAAVPSDNQRRCGRPGRRPRRRRGRLRPRRSTRTGRVDRDVSLRPIADRGLLRRQQTHEGVPRFGQRRHQFAAVHGLRGRRPPPRLRRRRRARLLRRLRRGGRHRLRRLQRRLVSPRVVSARRAGEGAARRAHRHDRPAPHGDGGTFRPASVDRARRRHGPVLPPSGRDRRRRRLDRAYVEAHTSGFEGRSRGPARSRPIAQRRPRAAVSPSATSSRFSRCGSARRASSPPSARASTSRRRGPTRSTRSSTSISRPGASASRDAARSR